MKRWDTTDRKYGPFYKEHDLEYDPTNGKSIEHFKIAVQFYKEVGDYMGVAKSSFEMGNAYGLEGKIEDQCRLFRESLAAFNKGKTLKEGQHPFHITNPNFKDFEEMHSYFMKNYGCEK